jgi:hypothetical protein
MAVHLQLLTKHAHIAFVLVKMHDFFQELCDPERDVSARERATIHFTSRGEGRREEDGPSKVNFGTARSEPYYRRGTELEWGRHGSIRSQRYYSLVKL